MKPEFNALINGGGYQFFLDFFFHMGKVSTNSNVLNKEPFEVWGAAEQRYVRIYPKQFQMDHLSFQPSIMSEKLFREPLLKERMPFLSHPDHPLVHYNQVQPTDLKDETFLVTGPECTYRIMVEQVF